MLLGVLPLGPGPTIRIQWARVGICKLYMW